MPITLDGSAGISGATTGTFSGNVTANGLSTELRPLVLDTAKTATGTAVDFTGIPSWVKRVTVMFNAVSTNGTSIPQIQIGGSGGIENTGYSGAASSELTGSTTVTQFAGAGFALLGTSSAAPVLLTGHVTLFLQHASVNVWIGSGSLIRADTAAMHRTGGAKALAGVLDRIRITTVNGTDTFDAGTINIMYE